MLRQLLKRAYALRCLNYIFTDVLAGLRSGSNAPAEEHGTTHSQLSVRESTEYIEDVFNDYKRYSGIARFHGRVAEIGPGDNCGVGLLCLADGCESVDLADRFYSRRDSQAQAAIYAELAVRHPEIGRRLASASLVDERSFPGIHYFTGESAAAEQFFRVPANYDFIVSRAVLEHLYDPMLALERMAAALKPTGFMLHKVDFKNHGLFAGGFHELKFLEVPPALYRLMNRNLARPNRTLISAYRDYLERSGLDFRILVTQLVGCGAVEPHVEYRDLDPGLRTRSLKYVRMVRASLAAPFKGLSEEDLSVSGIFVIARKNAASEQAGHS